jgi:glutamate carboxypeptidase
MMHATMSHFRRFIPIFLTVLPLVACAQTADVEQRMIDFIDEHDAEARALLERAVNVNSGSMNFEGVREVGAIFEAEFDDLGFETRWVDGAGWGRAGHLIAERRGSGPSMVLIGHLDTVFEPESPFQSYELLDESSARGPGVVDMKGGNVIMIQAMKALRSAGVLDSVDVTVVLIGDEEKSGRPIPAARADLIEAARGAEIALGFENGDGNPRTAVISRRGWTGWVLRVWGRPAHSSQIFQEGIGAGAVFEGARILTDFYEELSGEPYLTFNPAVALGGSDVEFEADQDRGAAAGKINIIAEHAVIPGDLRTLTIEQREEAKAAMRSIVERNLPNTSAEISFEDTYPPMAPSDGNRRLLALYDQVSRELGEGPVEAVDPRNAGAADVSFTAEHVAMAIDGLGMMGTGGHTVEETADLTALRSQSKRAAVLIYRLSSR